MHQRLAPDRFSILLNNPKQPLHAKNYFKKRYFEIGLSKNLFKKLSLFFLSNPVPFNSQSDQKQKGSGISCQLLFRSRNKFRKTSFIHYILSDQV